jgi:biotin-(acetyl-CoA carboxylase) ligase
LLETGEECDLVEIRKVLYNSIEHYYEKTRSAQIISLRNEYHQQIYRKGLPTTFVKGDEIILGTIMGVDEIGRLRLLIGGREELFNFNELKMINNKDIL